MRLLKDFEVDQGLETTAAILSQDETLVGIFPDSQTRIVAQEGNCKTTVSRYRALGREGEAKFHFTFAADGSVSFEKVCDGHVWGRLEGSVVLEPTRSGGTRITLEMEGRTKGLVPEFTIKAPMRDQLEQMAAGLRARIEASG